MSGYDIQQQLNAALVTLKNSKTQYNQVNCSDDYYYVTKRYAELVPIGHDNTQCLYPGCSSIVCHEGCGVGDNKKSCSCMEERDGSWYCTVCKHEYTQHNNQTHRQVIREVKEQVKNDKTQLLKKLQEQIYQNFKIVEHLQAQLPNPITFLNINKQNNKDLEPSQQKIIQAQVKQKKQCNLTQKQIAVARQLVDKNKMEQLGFKEDVEYTTLDSVYIKKKSPKLVSYLRGEIPQELKGQQDDEFNKQALCNYAQQDAVESVEKLIKVYKYDVNYIPPNLGKAPIHIAAEAGNLDTVDFLIKNQADINLVDNNNKKPYQLAKNPKVKERLVNEYNFITKQKSVFQKLNDFKSFIDQIVQNERQDSQYYTDLINMINSDTNDKKDLVAEISSKVEEIFERISQQVNNYQRDIVQKCKEMVSDIYLLGENPKELKQMLQKIQEEVKFDKCGEIESIKQKEIQTAEDYKKYLEQFEERLRGICSQNVEEKNIEMDLFVKNYNLLRNNTNMLIKYPAIIFESSQSSDLYKQVSLHNFQNYKLNKVETFEQLIEDIQCKHNYNFTLLINTDLNQQQINILDQMDKLNTQNQPVLRKIFLVGRKLENIQVPEKLQEKLMCVSKNSKVINHLFYDDKNLKIQGMIPSEMLFLFINNSSSQDIVLQSTPISKNEIELFKTYEEFLQYNTKICEEINISMFLRQNNSAINLYKANVSRWINYISSENKKQYEDWHINKQETIGLMNSYTQGPFCYFLNVGINLGDEKIFQYLSRQILLLNYSIQNYDDRKPQDQQDDLIFYRTIGMDSQLELDQVYNQYNENQIFYFPAFTSSSSNAEFSEKWMKQNDRNYYIMFNIYIKKQYNIPYHQRPKYLEEISLFKGQKEFLFPFFSKFQCISKEIKNKNNKKVYEITIEQIPK
ncbi:ankyrin repeat protein (macronuclear) [Tetrahymena thermophila SB210]|uniref:Ankyrin repeat protein n=1 Tax=Tetrahymena thermophila (strain SB210) TaxID=312017 RepID=I7LTB0_TETTS|nr:ankyrin repeat protein [Tetrahymena thermophila SB210]EAR84919.2 ankyrin repeat protein [Tetrahymena thermophila SB210]|eukprot:XP_001032582.2 ankyrin repeat protein [Tetrahymena thermophila SB210]